MRKVVIVRTGKGYARVSVPMANYVRIVMKVANHT